MTDGPTSTVPSDAPTNNLSDSTNTADGPTRDDQPPLALPANFSDPSSTPTDGGGNAATTGESAGPSHAGTETPSGDPRGAEAGDDHDLQADAPGLSSAPAGGEQAARRPQDSGGGYGGGGGGSKITYRTFEGTTINPMKGTRTT